MDLLKTPKQLLLEKTNVLPRFAKGKKVLSPEDMKAEIVVQKTMRQKLAAGGRPESHPGLAKAWNNLFK